MRRKRNVRFVQVKPACTLRERALCRCGIHCSSSPEQKHIEKLMMKIRTKAKLLTSSPEPQPNSELAADAYNVKPHLHKAPCCMQYLGLKHLTLKFFYCVCKCRFTLCCPTTITFCYVNYYPTCRGISQSTNYC